MSLDIVILAAGQGKRMKSDKAKVLHEVAFKPMLFHVIETAYKLNPNKIIIVVGHLKDDVINSVKTIDEAILSKIYFIEQKEQLGTANALASTIDILSSDANTLILYGDTPLTPYKILNELCSLDIKNGMALLTAKAQNPEGYGRIVRDDNDEIAYIVEQKDCNETEVLIDEVNTGMMLINNEAIKTFIPKIKNDNAQHEYYLTDMVKLLKDNNLKVETLLCPDITYLLGVNDKVQLAIAERNYQKQKALEFMQDGLTLADPNRFDIRGNLKFGKNCFIDINVIIKGNVVLGDNVVIGASSIINDCTIDDNTVVSPFTVMNQSTLCKNVTIGPFAHLRPNNTLNDDVHVGNFVEVKNSSLGKGTKSGHLTYIGDSEVGENVNFGAGTITCNYDGAFKHKTIIGNDVFVGSDTQLVAPVTVGDGVTIGAGTTVTKNLENNCLYITRAKGRVITTYIRPRKEKK